LPRHAAGIRSPPRLTGEAGIRRLSSRFRTLRCAIARRQLNFQFDQFIPQGIAAIAVRNGQQFTQATARVERRGRSR
jgi:hypothetical protein